MFWNIVLKPNQSVPVKVQSFLHLTNACLEISAKTDSKQRNTLSIIPEDQIGEVQLLTLIPNICEHATLDIVIGGGEEITLINTGSHQMHVSGYLINVNESTEEQE
ncbi:Nucleoplasmin-like domain-containing protein [Entamoeba marina]